MTRRRLRGDEGAATTELVIVAPAFLFLILLIVQFGLYFHAINVASAAAQEGARDASFNDATLADGQATAEDLVQTLAPELLSGVQVLPAYVDGGDSVRMTVEGDVSQVVAIPGIDLSITVNESAETPVEDFRASGETLSDDSP